MFRNDSNLYNKTMLLAKAELILDNFTLARSENNDHKVCWSVPFDNNLLL
jgi:hypothetical protein